MNRIFRSFFVIAITALLLCACYAPTEAPSGLRVIAKGKGSERPDITFTSTAAEHDPVTVHGDLILNINSKTIHTDPDCTYVRSMKDANKRIVSPDKADEYLSAGYKFCLKCSSEYIDQ